MIERTPEQIVKVVRRAGIVGAGGGGFPTYVKLQAEVEMIIANGSECEPLLASDRTMMVTNAGQLVAGVQLAMQATGAKQGVIGIKEHYHDAVAALNKVLPEDGSIKLHLLENYYPAGDEFLLVYEVTGKVIPEGGIPLHVGVVVNNVITLMQVAEAVSGKPVIERTITLAGEFKEPKVVTVPVGTTYAELINIAGGLKDPEAVLIDGGPMMGQIVDDLNAGVAKTTSGLLAFPKDHFVVRMASKPLPQMVKQSKSACCQCFRCSDLCPRNLIGHELFPHRTMRTIDYNQADPTKHITSAYLCSQCGVCELIACDFMMLSPRKIFAAYRQELMKKGVKNPHNRKVSEVNSQFENRKVSIPTVMKKIDIAKYDVKLNYVGRQEVKKVRIPLRRHAGAPALPSVALWQQVRMCDLIAQSPQDKLGTCYHASIGGKVTEISEDYIEIQG
ncbi:MAG: SLBB domain-containing protein [Gammaproteobacteria bacterium]|nr:SLBB domain-containing protein [Gammaproteobacteria bacterium]